MESPRFDDANLQEFYMAFQSHRAEHREFMEAQTRKNDELINAIKDNTSAVASLASKVADIVSKTEGIIEIYESGKGFAKVTKMAGQATIFIAAVITAVIFILYHMHDITL